MNQIWARLPYKTFELSGDDTVNFLQGQLTQDINYLDETHCHYGAYCSNKGRMFAVFLLHKQNDNVYLRLTESTTKTVMGRLKMFVLRSKVQFEALDCWHIGCDRQMAMAFCNAHELTLPQSEFSTTLQSESNVAISALPNDYYEIRFDASSDYAKWFDEQKDSENSQAVNVLRLSSGNFNILAEGVEKWLPQQSPLEFWGAINYKKGCYVGQEIIARNKYLGQLKKGFAIGCFDAPVTLSPTQNIYENERPIGQVIESQSLGDKTYCLALLPFDKMNTSLTIESQETAVFTPIAFNTDTQPH